MWVVRKVTEDKNKKRYHTITLIKEVVMVQNMQNDTHDKQDPQLEQQPLLEDFDAPFSDPNDIPNSDKEKSKLNHPQTDTNVDAHESYDEGRSAAAEINPPAGQASDVDEDSRVE